MLSLREREREREITMLSKHGEACDLEVVITTPYRNE